MSDRRPRSGSRFESLPEDDEGEDSFLTSPSRAQSISSQSFARTPQPSTSHEITPSNRTKPLRYSAMRTTLFPSSTPKSSTSSQPFASTPYPSTSSQSFETTPQPSTSYEVTPLRKPKRRSPRYSTLRTTLFPGSEEQTDEGIQFEWRHFRREPKEWDDSGIEGLSQLFEETEESIEQKLFKRGAPKNMRQDIEYLREIGYSIDYPDGRLGNGMFGVVYRGSYGTTVEDFENVEPRRRFAVKVVDFSKGGYTDSDRENFESEKYILTKVCHKNVVGIRNIINMGEIQLKTFEDYPYKGYLTPDRAYLIMDFADHGELEYYLSKNYNRIEPSTRIKFIRDLFWGMLYLHRNLIVHGDVHVGNVLIFTGFDDELIAKWSDFGLSGIACKKQYRYRKPQITRSFFQDESPFDIIGMTTIFDTILQNRILGRFESEEEKERLDECQRMVNECRNVESLRDFHQFRHVLEDELYFDEHHYD